VSQADFKQLFLRIPLFEGQTPEDFTITRLPGYTNRNYRLVNQRQDWVLRIPRPTTNRFIDRDAEAVNQANASDLGIAPRPVWRANSGVTLTPTLSASHSLTPRHLADSATLRKIVAPVSKLHRSGICFQGRVQLDQLLTRYYSLLSPQLQAKYRLRLQAARQLIPQLQDRDPAYVASHNDLVLENLLLEQDRVWLIDWEFSAMASPYWDLATICNAAGFNLQQSRQLLDAYCAGSVAMEESLLFDYRNLLQLLSDCWLAALAD